MSDTTGVTASDTIGFSDYTNMYLAHYRSRNGYRPRVAPATMRRKITSVHHLQSIFGNIPLSSITTHHIVECIAELEQHGQSMARSDAAELKTIMHRAAMHHDDQPPLVAFNPAQDVPLPQEPLSRQTQKKPISMEEEQELYDWFLHHRPQWAIMILIGCNVDLRPQDYLALKVGDIDPHEMTINIVRSQSFVTGHGLITKSPETRASAQKRYVARELMRRVMEHIRHFTDGKPDSWLIEGPRGGMLSETLFYKWFKRAGASIGRADITPYVMRATADDRISRGHFGNTKEMLVLQGRSDASTSIRHYQKLNDDSMRSHVEQIWQQTHVTDADSSADDLVTQLRRQVNVPRQELQKTEHLLDLFNVIK